MCRIVVKRIGIVAHAIAVGIDGLTGVGGEDVRIVTYAVVIGVGCFRGVVGEIIGVIAHTITVAVKPLVGVVGEGVGVVARGVVAVAITVAVGCLRRIVVKGVAVITHAVAVGVGPFVLVVGKSIALVAVAVAVGVVIDDFDGVGRRFRCAHIGTVARGDRHRPEVADGQCAWWECGLVVVLGLGHTALQPANLRIGFVVAVLVAVIVIGVQRGVVVRFGDGGCGARGVTDVDV